MRHAIFNLILYLLVALVFVVKVEAQSKLFDSHEPIEIELITNLKNLFRDVNPKTAHYHESILFYFYSDTSYSIPVKLKTRGIFRRDKTNCNLPPLSLKPINANDEIFNTSRKIKLVNPCFNNKRYEQYLFKEYLAYRIFNILTEYSFRVRLARVIYIDNSGKFKNFITHSFFIEPIGYLEQRLNVKEIKTQGIIQNATYRMLLDRMAFSQFMIGNTDWSVPKLHNIKLVYSDSLYSLIPIPYDFDFCGLVDPPYTKPPDIIPINHVTERYYRGNCRSADEFKTTIDFFLSKKEDIYNLIYSDTLLNKKNKLSVIKYIDNFYNIITNERLVKKEIIDNCRNE